MPRPIHLFAPAASPKVFGGGSLAHWFKPFGTGTSAEIKEERRPLYVAMTRAKDDLHLVVPQRFFVYGQHAHGDRHLYASRTRLIRNKLSKARAIVYNAVWRFGEQIRRVFRTMRRKRPIAHSLCAALTSGNCSSAERSVFLPWICAWAFLAKTN